MDAEEYILHSEKKRHKGRLLIWVSLSSIFFAAAFKYFSTIEVPQFLIDQLQNNWNALVGFLIVVAFAGAMLSYLQSGSIFSNLLRDSDSVDPIRPNINFLRKIETKIERNSAHLRVLAKIVEDQKAELDEKFSNRKLTSEERIQLEKNVAEGIGHEAVKRIFASEAAEFQESLKKKILIDRVISISENIIDRINKEISRLGWRANINLTIGASITVVGLYILWSLTNMVDTSDVLKRLASEGAESDSSFYKNLILPLIPRVSLVIFLELFAYFFLRLYRRGLEEIKFFQNELTNVQSKLASVEISIITNCEVSLKATLDMLARTERNFILEKGQSTIDLERAKHDSHLSRKIISLIPDIIKRSKE